MHICWHNKDKQNHYILWQACLCIGGPWLCWKSGQGSVDGMSHTGHQDNVKLIQHRSKGKLVSRSASISPTHMLQWVCTSLERGQKSCNSNVVGQVQLRVTMHARYKRINHQPEHIQLFLLWVSILDLGLAQEVLAVQPFANTLSNLRERCRARNNISILSQLARVARGLSCACTVSRQQPASLPREDGVPWLEVSC